MTECQSFSETAAGSIIAAAMNLKNFLCIIFVFYIYCRSRRHVPFLGGAKIPDIIQTAQTKSMNRHPRTIKLPIRSRSRHQGLIVKLRPLIEFICHYRAQPISLGEMQSRQYGASYQKNRHIPAAGSGTAARAGTGSRMQRQFESSGSRTGTG